MIAATAYNVAAFIEKAKAMNLGNLVVYCHQEHDNLKRLNITPKSHLWGDKYKIEEYRHFIGEFCFLITHMIRPAGMSNEEFRATKEIIESLVARNELNQDVLNLYR